MAMFDEQAVLAQAILDNRRGRADGLPAELFAEHAWEALLHLFIADTRSQRLTGAELAQIVGCPPSVMSRWLKYLSAERLVVGDGQGELAVLLTLSPHALHAIEGYLTQTQALAGTLFARERQRRRSA